MTQGPGDPAMQDAGTPAESRLGQLPEIAALAGFGVLLVTVGDALARQGVGIGDVFFWTGLLVVVGPVGWRLVGTAPSRPERLGLVLLMGLALYLVKVLHSPDGFTMYDELQHLRTADDIMATGHLFARNPLLLVSPLYPGLEIVTTTLMRVTGAGAFESGLVVIAAGRFLLMIGLFLLFEHASGSARIAGIASFVYTAHPNFVFFSAQFGYESLAIGLAIGVIYLVAISRSHWVAGSSGALLIAAACIATHHATTYALIALLIAWAVLQRLVKVAGEDSPNPGRVAVLTTIGAAAWLVFIANETIRYLGPRFIDALELIRLILGDVAGRQLFRPAQGVLAAEWERVIGYAAVVILLAALPVGLWRIWRQFRRRSPALLLALVAASYPATLGLRLTQAGAEEAARTSSYVFVGVGFIVAFTVTVSLRVPDRIRRDLRPLLAVAGLVIFVGGVVVGVPRWNRLPGPYLPSADSRSIQPQAIEAATWARTELGPDQRIVADRINRIMMGYYGRQTPVTNYGDQIKTYNLFYSPTFDPEDLAIIQKGDIDYIVIDRRLAGIEPLSRVYFENGERLEVARAAGLTMAGLTKFGSVPGVNLVFDSGDIRIYDVRALSRGAPT